MLPTQQNTVTKCIVYPGAEEILSSVSVSEVEISFHISVVGAYLHSIRKNSAFERVVVEQTSSSSSSEPIMEGGVSQLLYCFIHVGVLQGKNLLG